MKIECKDAPLIVKLASPSPIKRDVYDGHEQYDEMRDLLVPGQYWMGSNKTNTRCNKFTVFGADKTHADDTKEKSK